MVVLPWGAVPLDSRLSCSFSGYLQSNMPCCASTTPNGQGSFTEIRQFWEEVRGERWDRASFGVSLCVFVFAGAAADSAATAAATLVVVLPAVVFLVGVVAVRPVLLRQNLMATV